MDVLMWKFGVIFCTNVGALEELGVTEAEIAVHESNFPLPLSQSQALRTKVHNIIVSGLADDFQFVLVYVYLDI